MACMGNFQAFNWTSQRDNLKPATTNHPAAMDPQSDDEDSSVEESCQGGTRQFSRKRWSDSTYTKPTYQSSDNDLNEVQRYDHVVSLDNVKPLLRYDDVAAREWPYCADNTLPKIGTTPSAMLQVGDENSRNIRARPSCHMTKFVHDMNKTYKLFRMYGQTGIAPPM